MNPGFPAIWKTWKSQEKKKGPGKTGKSQGICSTSLEFFIQKKKYENRPFLSQLSEYLKFPPRAAFQTSGSGPYSAVPQFPQFQHASISITITTFQNFTDHVIHVSRSQLAMGRGFLEKIRIRLQCKKCSKLNPRIRRNLKFVPESTEI